MSVNIVWSLSNGGGAITSVVDHGNSGNGDTTTEKEIFIRHDGANVISGVGFFVRTYSGTYSGTHTPSADLNELLSWGDGNTVSAFGGFQMNMKRDQPGFTFDATAWPIYTDKAPSSGKGNTFRTGVGDSEGNPIGLKSSTGATVDGEIQTGSAPNVSFKLRIQVPSSEDTLGVRQWEQVVLYTFTS